MHILISPSRKVAAISLIDLPCRFPYKWSVSILPWKIWEIQKHYYFVFISSKKFENLRDFPPWNKISNSNTKRNRKQKICRRFLAPYIFVSNFSSTCCAATKTRSNRPIDYLHSKRIHLFANCPGPVWFNACGVFMVGRCVHEKVDRGTGRKKEKWSWKKESIVLCVWRAVWNVNFFFKSDDDCLIE